MKLLLEEIKDVLVDDHHRVTLVRAPGFGGTLWADRDMVRRIQERRARELRSIKSGLSNMRGAIRGMKG